MPAVEYVTDGFCKLDEVPFPKFHAHVEPATGVEVLLTAMVLPAHADPAVNCATGGVFTVMVLVTVLEQPFEAVATNVTEYVPAAGNVKVGF